MNSSKLVVGKSLKETLRRVTQPNSSKETLRKSGEHSKAKYGNKELDPRGEETASKSNHFSRIFSGGLLLAEGYSPEVTS